MIPEAKKYRLKPADVEVMKALAAERGLPVSQLGSAAVRYGMSLLGDVETWASVIAHHDATAWEGEGVPTQLDLSPAEYQALEILAIAIEEKRKATTDWNRKRHHVRATSLMAWSFHEFKVYLDKLPRPSAEAEPKVPGLELEYVGRIELKRTAPLVVENVRQLHDAVELSKVRRATPWVKRVDGALVCEHCQFRLDSSAGTPGDLRVIIELGFRKAHEKLCEPPAQAKPRPKKKEAR